LFVLARRVASIVLESLPATGSCWTSTGRPPTSTRRRTRSAAWSSVVRSRCTEARLGDFFSGAKSSIRLMPERARRPALDGRTHAW